MRPATFANGSVLNLACRDVSGWLTEDREVSVELVRGSLGVGLFARGILFSAIPRGLEVLVDPSAFSMAFAALAHYVAVAHLVGGLLVAAGLLTRIAGVAQHPILVGSVFVVPVPEGLLSANQALESSALVLFLLTLVFASGGSRWSADQYVFDRESNIQNKEPEVCWRDEAFEPPGGRFRGRRGDL